MDLTLLLCTPTSFPGRVISAVEHDAISHVALDMGDGWSIAEEPEGCWGRPSSHYGPKVLRWPLPLDPGQAQTVRDWLLAKVGTFYGYVQIIDDGAGILLHAPLTLPAQQRYTCSGVIAAACAEAGWTPCAPIAPAYVTPADWHRAMLAAVPVPPHPGISHGVNPTCSAG